MIYLDFFEKNTEFWEQCSGRDLEDPYVCDFFSSLSPPAAPSGTHSNGIGA
jgi:hypothetical protein